MSKVKASLVVSFTLIACGGGEDHQPRAVDPSAASTGDWSYEGDAGPSSWTNLSPSYGMCGDMEHESPVDLSSTTAVSDLPDLVPHYGESAASVTNNGHTLEFEYEPGSNVTVGGTDYELKQFHFHAHSEHSVDGMFSPMEMHMVHADAAGNKLVVAMFVKLGRENETLDDAGWAHLPKSKGERYVEPDARINVSELLPGGPTYRYLGSLTTPPCTENVQWVIFRSPIELSSDQIAAFTSIYDHDFRPTEPLGARVVSLGE